jgi:glucosyl-dolichyl phosphate glucuronosyltransferase
MKISVILCTRNRSERLGKTLDSLAKSVLPAPVEWEVLIVDNCSNDATRQVAESYCQRYEGRFRYLFEPISGKSRALNRGIQEARGDVLAFTDDDVTVEPTWLRNLTANLDNGKWAGSGGRTLPEQPFQTPPWIAPKRPHALAPLAIFDPALDAGRLETSPYGNNMAFQRKVFDEHGVFRVDMGPGLDAKSPQKSEDSEFGKRLLAAGAQLRYEPSAVLYHDVPPNRVQKAYFLAWWFDKARADIRADGIPKLGWTIAGVPVRLFLRVARWTLSWLTTLEPSMRFEKKTRVWINCGEIFECYRQRCLRASRISK